MCQEQAYIFHLQLYDCVFRHSTCSIVFVIFRDASGDGQNIVRSPERSLQFLQDHLSADACKRGGYYLPARLPDSSAARKWLSYAGGLRLTSLSIWYRLAVSESLPQNCRKVGVGFHFLSFGDR